MEQTIALIRDRYPGSPLDQLRQQEEKLIATLYPHLSPTLDQLRHFPNLLWLDVTAADLAGMSHAMLNYHVRPRDALHLTAMQKCGCFDVVSQDADFDRIPVLRRYVF
jgi:predicted nucleic acid-binding protein